MTNAPWRWLGGLTALYVALNGFRGVLAYETFNGLFDAAVFNQAYWNTVHGNGLFLSSLEGGSHFGVHFSPIMFLFVPFYYVLPSYKTLLLAEVLVMAAGIPAVYLLARLRLGEAASLGFATLYAASPLVQGMNLIACEGFHPVVLASVFLLYATYFLHRERPTLFVTFLGLALLCREDVALVGLFYGLAVALRGRRRLGGAVAAASLLYFVLSVAVVVPSFRSDGAYVVATPGLSYLGDSVGSILEGALTGPHRVLAEMLTLDKAFYAFALLLPLGFLPLLAPKELLPCVPQLLINLASTYEPNYSAAERYSAVVVPFLFVAAIHGAVRLSEKATAQRAAAFLRRHASVLTLALYVALSLLTVLYLRSPVCPGYTHPSSDDLHILQQVGSFLEPESAVGFSQHKGLVNVSARRTTGYLDAGCQPDYDVIVDNGIFPHFSRIPRELIDECLETLLSSKTYSIALDSDRLRVYVRTGE